MGSETSSFTTSPATTYEFQDSGWPRSSPQLVARMLFKEENVWFLLVTSSLFF